MCVCVCVRERETDRQTDREKGAFQLGKQGVLRPCGRRPMEHAEEWEEGQCGATSFGIRSPQFLIAVKAAKVMISLNANIASGLSSRRNSSSVRCKACW